MNPRTTRRSFFGAAGAASLGALAISPASAVIEPAPYGIKLGIATYTFRNFDRAKVIEMLKDLHVTYIGIKNTDQQLSLKASPAEIAAARQQFDDAGFKVSSAGNIDMTKAKTVEDLRPIFEWAKAARLPMLVCAPTHENIHAVEAMVKEYNIRIAIHNHGPEDKHFPTPQSVLEVVRPLDRRCGLCMDIGHTERAGVDPVKMVPVAGDRLFELHTKDLANFQSRESQEDVGDGVIPIPQLFQQLHKIDFQGCANLEYEIHADNPMPGVQRSMSYMRGVLAGLAAA